MLHGVRDLLAQAVKVEVQEHDMRVLRGGPIISHTPELEARPQRRDELALIKASRHVLRDLNGVAHQSRVGTAQ